MANSTAMNAYTLNPPDSESKPSPSAPAYPVLPTAAPAPVQPSAYPQTYMPPNYQYNPSQYNPPQYYPPQYYPSQPAPPQHVPLQNVPHQNPPALNAQLNISKINDWLPWSVINLCLGGVLLGFLPLIFSLVCRNKKKKNDLKGAKTMSNLALVFNIIVTILAVAVSIGLLIYLAYYWRGNRNIY